MALSGKLLRGTRFGLGFKSTAHNLQTTPFTVVARFSPDEGGLVEIVWKWRPPTSSGSPEFFWDVVNGRLVWKLTSSWTVSGFAVGRWRLYFLVGNPPVDQDNMTEYSLTVQDGEGGAPMPTI